MTGSEMITDFKLEGSTIRQLADAINKHLAKCGIEPEDRGFGSSRDWDHVGQTKTLIPDARSYRWLVAFAVEGGSEGYYIHFGALMHPAPVSTFGNWTTESPYGKISITPKDGTMIYMDFGHAKTYSAEQAAQIAKEAQRFLTAAAWN